jgi:hypothetical protein
MAFKSTRGLRVNIRNRISNSKRRCSARKKGGKVCRHWPVPGGNGRCWRHAGRATGPRTPEGKARALAAANEGLARWRERTRLAIAAGDLPKFPQGRKSNAERARRASPLNRSPSVPFVSPDTLAEQWARQRAVEEHHAQEQELSRKYAKLIEEGSAGIGSAERPARGTMA